ncbi:hypothetical protein FPV67DRAFT_1492227 [Lyophyllum atratum]|nr:hypothetical protein FPV67DRAFT_1492227 [Lyophyllum atratum]
MDELTESEIQQEFKALRDDADIEMRKDIIYSDFMHQWFLSHGYTLYTSVLDEDGDPTTTSKPLLPPDEPCNSEFPYAIFGGTSEEAVDRYEALTVFFAQDSQQRHVAIKIVADGSQEHKILRFLHELGSPVSQEDFT